MVRVLHLALFLLLLTACERPPVYRIGVQEDPAHTVLVEMIAGPLRLAGARVETVPCGELRPCIQALRTGEIHLLPAYSGDAVALIHSGSGADQEEGTQSAKSAFGTLGIQVLANLGFDAPFTVVTRSDLSDTLGARVETIADLGKLGDGLRLAVPSGYTSRPRDGLRSLLRRHGLSPRADGVISMPNAANEVTALLQGTVDAVIFRDFNYDLRDFGVVRLRDSLNFFPRYQAIMLASARVDASAPELRKGLDHIASILDSEAVGSVIQDVLVRGWSAREAARRSLARNGIQGPTSSRMQQPPMTLAFDPNDALGPGPEMASRIIVDAFPDYAVEILEVEDPFSALRSGQADLAIADTARFFLASPEGGFERNEPLVEAITVIGQRNFYLLQRGTFLQRGTGQTAAPFVGRVGIMPTEGTPGRIGSAILSGMALSPALEAEKQTLYKALLAGEIDAAILVGSLDAPEVVQALKAGSLRIGGLFDLDGRVPLILSETRLPAGTLPTQTEPLDTLSVQLLLAGPAPNGGQLLRAGGPVAALPAHGQPLSIEEAQALMLATPLREPPDPILQTIWERTPSRQGPAQGPRESLVDTLVNVVALAFIFWCLLLLIRRDRRGPPA